MTDVIPLIPRTKKNATENLATFIHYGKYQMTVFGKDLDFESNVWDITEHYIKKGYRDSKNGRQKIHFTQKLADGGAQFCPQILDFAKAYVRLRCYNCSSGQIRSVIMAFRALNIAIQELNVTALHDCDASVFNLASEKIRAASKVGENALGGSNLAKIAHFLDERGIVYAPLHDWRYIRLIKSSSGRIGPNYDYRKKKLMPSQDALDALAQAFNLAIEPKDIIVTSIAAILCSSPDRINELLVLSQDCITERNGEDGKKYLGLKWAGSKKTANHVKWILPGMADVVRIAIAKIRSITEPARIMARWYEKHPDKMYLPAGFEYLRNKEILQLDELGMLLNLSDNKEKRTVRRWCNTNSVPFTIVKKNNYISGRKLIQTVRYTDFEKKILSMLPLDFPMCDSSTGLKYSEALMIVPQGLFGNRSSGYGSRCMFESVRYHHVHCQLGQNQSAGSATVFQRTGLDPDKKLFVKSHQFRHWLNTLAQQANLSQVDIAKWSGRSSICQNAAYDHVSSKEIIAKIRSAIGDHAKAIGPIAEIPQNLPVSKIEFAKLSVSTVHATLYGFCIHDFTTSPCELFRKCLDCKEHVCVKGLSEKETRLRQILAVAQKNLAIAKGAVKDEVYGAEDWVDTHQATVIRLEQLLSILSDPTVAQGAVIQLTGSNIYTLSEGALLERGVLVHCGQSVPALRCEENEKA